MEFTQFCLEGKGVCTGRSLCPSVPLSLPPHIRQPQVFQTSIASPSGQAGCLSLAVSVCTLGSASALPQTMGASVRPDSQAAQGGLSQDHPTRYAKKQVKSQRHL